MLLYAGCLRLATSVGLQINSQTKTVKTDETRPRKKFNRKYIIGQENVFLEPVFVADFFVSRVGLWILTFDGFTTTSRIVYSPTQLLANRIRYVANTLLMICWTKPTVGVALFQLCFFLLLLVGMSCRVIVCQRLKVGFFTTKCVFPPQHALQSVYSMSVLSYKERLDLYFNSLGTSKNTNAARTSTIGCATGMANAGGVST